MFRQQPHYSSLEHAGGLRARVSLDKIRAIRPAKAKSGYERRLPKTERAGSGPPTCIDKRNQGWLCVFLIARPEQYVEPKQSLAASGELFSTAAALRLSMWSRDVTQGSLYSGLAVRRGSSCREERASRQSIRSPSSGGLAEEGSRNPNVLLLKRFTHIFQATSPVFLRYWTARSRWCACL